MPNAETTPKWEETQAVEEPQWDQTTSLEEDQAKYDERGLPRFQTPTHEKEIRPQTLGERISSAIGFKQLPYQIEEERLGEEKPTDYTRAAQIGTRNIVAPLLTPKGAIIAAGATVAPEIALPYFTYEGIKGATRSIPAAMQPGISGPERFRRSLEAGGNVAMTAAPLLGLGRSEPAPAPPGELAGPAATGEVLATPPGYPAIRKRATEPTDQPPVFNRFRRPEVPGTPAEPRTDIIGEIRAAGAKTVNDIRRAINAPATMPKEQLKALGKQAWGQWPPPAEEAAPKFEETQPEPPTPPEEPPPAPGGAPVETPPPTPPAAPGGAPVEPTPDIPPTKPELSGPPATTLPPTMETVRKVAQMSAMDFYNQVGRFNKINLEIGERITPEEAAEVRKLQQENADLAKKVIAEGYQTKDISKVNEGGALGLKAQFYSEILRRYDAKAGTGETVTLYTGKGGAGGAGQGGSWFTGNAEKARSYGPEVTAVQVPKDVAEAAKAAAEKQGQGGDTYFLTKDLADKAKPIETPPEKVNVIEEAPAAAAPDLSKVVIAGRTLPEWMAAKVPANIPAGTALTELARRLGVKRDRRAVWEALKNEKRLGEIFKPFEPQGAPIVPQKTIAEEPEKITAAAYQPAPGQTETGANHPEILSRLGVKGFEDPESRNTPQFGFQTNKRPFITREEAGTVATGSGQNLKDFEPGEPVHSNEVESPTEPGTPLSEAEQKEVQDELASLAGPGSPARGQGPDPAVVGLSAGNQFFNRVARQFQNLYQGIGQLWNSRVNKQVLSQLANAADNLPRLFGHRAGNSIRLRSNEQERTAITFLMQALKMSGDGLSVENAARLGELEHAGDPHGYLEVRADDMETQAQVFLNEGKKLEAQAAIDAAKAMRYARENFDRLRPLAELAKEKFDAQLAREGRAGIDTDYENWYVPQRHDLDLIASPDRPIVLGQSRGTGTATGFRKAKVYEDYATAIENGFVPRSLDIADLLEHRVNQGERLISRSSLFNRMRGMEDPSTGLPLATDMRTRRITRQDGTTDLQRTAPPGYKPVEVMPGRMIAVHEGYEPLMKALFPKESIADSALFRGAQQLAGIEKHLMLALDTFHASRTMQAELALTHKISLGDRQRLGRALVEYDPKDLAAAVQKGEITQEIADFITTPQEMEINGRTIRITPAKLIQLGTREGLNVARFNDVLYSQWVRDLPVIGTVNKWVFDKLTRSAIAHGFLSEFERVAKANPELSANEVARKVASDVNVLFGNLQKESIFKNPSIKAINQLVFLAPNWVEALARREFRAARQLGEVPFQLAKGQAPRLGTAARGIGTGLAAYFVAAQVLNLITRKQLTFSNPEKGHKLDAWVPDPTGKTKGYFISPLSVFGEITHDILRYAREKPDLTEAINQIGANKLGPLSRALWTYVSGRDHGTGEKLVGTANRALRAGVQAAPVPISISQAGRALASKVAPGAISPPAPGMAVRQAAASLGFKSELAPSAQRQIYAKADEWKSASDNPKLRAQVERRLKEDFGPSEYTDLRTALIRNDVAGAKRAYDKLRETKEADVINRALKHPHPFTGSATAERSFRRSLSDKDKELYDEALSERKELYQRFRKMLSQD